MVVEVGSGRCPQSQYRLSFGGKIDGRRVIAIPGQERRPRCIKHVRAPISFSSLQLRKTQIHILHNALENRTSCTARCHCVHRCAASNWGGERNERMPNGYRVCLLRRHKLIPLLVAKRYLGNRCSDGCVCRLSRRNEQLARSFKGKICSRYKVAPATMTEMRERRVANVFKLCRCPGCHSKYINDAIARLFPPPCN